jgi:hypothetical protein
MTTIVEVLVSVGVIACFLIGWRLAGFKGLVLVLLNTILICLLMGTWAANWQHSVAESCRFNKSHLSFEERIDQLDKRVNDLEILLSETVQQE